MKLRDWKIANIPPTGLCPNCLEQRGTDPEQWALLPDHMYCKYCFRANVADSEESQRLRKAFIKQLKTMDDTVAVKTTDQMIREIYELVVLQYQAQQQQSILLTQFTQFESKPACRAFIAKLMDFEDAPNVLGRYLIGPELEAKYGDRLEQLIEVSPASLIRDLNGVIHTPGIAARRNELLEDPPEWLIQAMAPYTRDPDMFSVYSVAYVAALLKDMR